MPLPNTFSGTRRRILIVEDQSDARETLKVLLKLHGHSDGYQLARDVRTTLGPTPFLIALTAYGSAEDQKRSTAAGFNLHLVKPADPYKLCQIVEQKTC
jgi:CheY-like chemotaxis protein